MGQIPPTVLNLKKESRTQISLANIFEVVAEDLQMLNQNLKSVSIFCEFFMLAIVERG